MLKTRFLVAVVALPLLVAVILVGGWLFALVVLAALLLGGLEYVQLLRQGQYQPPLVLALALIALAWGAVWFEHPDWLTPGLALLLIAGMFYAIWEREHTRSHPIVNTALAAFGGVYIGWLGSHLLAVRLLDDGAFLTLFLYGLVITTDTAAYFAGRTWGKHKLSPLTSPKKTWEGYAASALSGPLVGALGALLPGHDTLTVLHGALLGLLIGILGTVGDLAMSAVKREVGAKDSSHLIPGHGGILDRTDSVLVAAVIGYYYITWFIR